MRFAGLLKERISGLDIRNVGEKVTTFFNSKADALISESTKDSTSFYQ